jgi:hypothetical protein
MSTSKVKKAVAAGALVLAGVGVGGVAAGTLSAGATTGDPSTSSSTATPSAPEQLDPSKSIRPEEELLTGTTAEKVRAAALAKYPDATIQRVETDSDGVYEAHIVTAAGDEVIVQLDEDFTVTGTQTGGPGGRGGFDDHDGDGPDVGSDSSAKGSVEG